MMTTPIATLASRMTVGISTPIAIFDPVPIPLSLPYGDSVTFSDIAVETSATDSVLGDGSSEAAGDDCFIVVSGDNDCAGEVGVDDCDTIVFVDTSDTSSVVPVDNDGSTDVSDDTVV